MRGRISRLFLRPEPPSLLAGLLVAVLAVALNTSLIYPLREIASADPSGVAYPLAVLLVATLGASGLGLLTSVLSAARSTISISRRRGSSPSRTAAAGSRWGPFSLLGFDVLDPRADGLRWLDQTTTISRPPRRRFRRRPRLRAGRGRFR